ncbi:PEGA domain-containing protein [Polyangium aurulentum]|uniref:PEGA domain-containing protein n=1 Tax=Polyangium aurulentum TaxID=2567896 RepID=UPI0010AEBDA1|nr:PEGA domain-containing protein [Polyangium aurulentum]UQA62461.1 PEGA domain-containing protein [Polyangium aurulentum]
MISLPRRPLALALAVALGVAAQATAPGVAFAQEQVSQAQIQLARQAASEGLQAYRAGEFDKALNLFEQAKALYPSAQILRMIGYSLLALERWQPAAEAMEAALASKVTPLGEDDRKDVNEQLAKAMAHIGVLTVTSKVEGAKVAIDAEPPTALPVEKLRMPPGKHKLTVTAPEHEDEVQEIDLEGGKPLELSIDPKPVKKPEPPKPPPPPPPPKKVGWFPHQRAIGFGLLGTGVGVGLGALATGLTSIHLSNNVDRDTQIHQAVYGTNCSRGDLRFCNLDRKVISADASDANTLRTVTLGLGIGAGVLVATGVVFVIVGGPSEKPKDEAPAAPAPATGGLRSLSCGPFGGAGLSCTGTF